MYQSLNRNHWIVIITWLILALMCLAFALSGFGLGKVWNRTVTQPGFIPNSESYKATEIINQNRNSNYQVYLLVTGVDMEKQHKEVLNVLNTSAKDLQDIPGVIPAGVLHPFAAGDNENIPAAKQLMDQFIARDKQGFLMVVLLDLTQFPERAEELRQTTETALETIAPDLRSFAPKANGLVTDTDLENLAISNQASSDFSLAYLVALTLIAVILLLALGNARQAAMIFSATILGLLFSRAVVNLASVFISPNPEDPTLVTMLSLGIASGYGFIFLHRAKTAVAVAKYTSEIPKISSSRFRQQRKRRKDSSSALDSVFAHTATAVTWSTGLLILGLATVALFPANSLRWVAVVSIISMLGCYVIGLTFVPALIYSTSHYLDLTPAKWHTHLRSAINNIWMVTSLTGTKISSKLPHSRYLGTSIAAVALLILCIPAAGVAWHTSTATDLPDNSQPGHFHQQRAIQYGQTGAESDIQVVAKTTHNTLTTWSAQVNSIKNVQKSIVDPNTYGNYTILDVRLRPNTDTRSAMKVVSQIRSLNTQFPKMVTGQAASQIDFGRSILKYVPLLAGIMIISSILVMSRATRRFGATAVAGILIAVTEIAALGITALVFQDGILSWLPFFSKSDGVAPSVAVLLVGYGFALALDYQLYALNKQRLPVPQDLNEGLADDTFLSELTQSRTTLWARTALMLVTFLSFLPTHLQAVRQSAFALLAVILINALWSRLLLYPLLKPYPDQNDDSILIWKDETRPVRTDIHTASTDTSSPQEIHGTSTLTNDLRDII